MLPPCRRSVSGTSRVPASRVYDRNRKLKRFRVGCRFDGICGPAFVGLPGSCSCCRLAWTPGLPAQACGSVDGQVSHLAWYVGPPRRPNTGPLQRPLVHRSTRRRSSLLALGRRSFLGRLCTGFVAPLLRPTQPLGGAHVDRTVGGIGPLGDEAALRL